jgi:periodic tryptophan protein 2
LVKYRNFRTFTSVGVGDGPNKKKTAQFNCLAIEPSGDIVVAGALDPYDIYLWSLRTGQLLEVLSSHEAPVSSLCFSSGLSQGWGSEREQEAAGSLLASSSWD